MENSELFNCSNCKKAALNLLVCSNCHVARYCNSDCQKNDWDYHKRKCRELKEIKNWDPQIPIEIDHFKNLELVGEGNFSEILKAQHKVTNKVSAIKRVNKIKLQRIRKEKDIQMEVHCLKKLAGIPEVIDFFHYFEDELHIYLNFEYVNGGELWDIVKVFGLIFFDQVKYFIFHLINVFEKIHARGIIHRDIKPENILLTKDKKIKIVDFGTARDDFENLKGSGNSAKGKMVYDHFVGTPNYMAPEQIHNTCSDYKSDVWALGCTFYNLLAGFSPFIGKSEYLIFLKSDKEDPIFEEGIFPPQFQEFLLKLLKRNIDDRISLQEIKKEEFYIQISKEVQEKQFDEIYKDDQEQSIFKLKQELESQKFDSIEKVDEIMGEHERKEEYNKSWVQFLKKRLKHINKLEEFEYQVII